MREAVALTKEKNKDLEEEIKKQNGTIEQNKNLEKELREQNSSLGEKNNNTIEQVTCLNKKIALLEGKNNDLEEEIKRQNGTIEELKSSSILENKRLEKNNEELSNASLYLIFRLEKVKIL